MSTAEYIILGRGTGYQIARTHDLAIAGFKYSDGLEYPRMWDSAAGARDYLDSLDDEPDAGLIWITETRQ